MQFTKIIGLTQLIVGVALLKRKQKVYGVAGIMGRNNLTLVYNTLWVGKLLNNPQVVYRTKIIRYYWRFSNRCFHGIIHPLKNGLDISISFQGLGKRQFNQYFSAETGFTFYGYFSTHQFNSMVHIHHSQTR